MRIRLHGATASVSRNLPADSHIAAPDEFVTADYIRIFLQLCLRRLLVGAIG